jgi:hypothetical protein
MLVLGLEELEWVLEWCGVGVGVGVGVGAGVGVVLV